MNKEFNTVDAFLALDDIDDDEILATYKIKNVNEGKEFRLNTYSKELEDARNFLEDSKNKEPELEVIDPDADSLDHLKSKTDYIGQIILRCNKCMANRFIDAKDLEESEKENGLYNVDDECPHCHSVGSGYEKIGQVGAVKEPEEEKPINEPDDLEEPVEEKAAEEEPSIESDEEKKPEEAKFDNDHEENTEEAEEEEVKEEPEEQEDVEDAGDYDEEEPDGMETDVTEDDDDIKLPKLGDKFDDDDVREDDTEKNESLNEVANDEDKNEYAETAWMMNKVISYLNDEEAYYGSWLYIWPDGETKKACYYDFGDKESFDDLEKEFVKIYKRYHDSGIYDAPQDVIDFAHKYDSLLNLSSIEVIKGLKEEVQNKKEEKVELNTANDLIHLFIAPEKIKEISIKKKSEDDKDIIVFKGKLEELPAEVLDSKLVSFNVDGSYLIFSIDNTGKYILEEILNKFDDDKTENISIVKNETSEELFSGKKEDIIENYGETNVLFAENPNSLTIYVEGDFDYEYEEPVEDAADDLIEQLLLANDLLPSRKTNINCTEYWINESIKNKEDLKLIYEKYVLNTQNQNLINEFKNITGYKDAVDEAKESIETLQMNETAARDDDLVAAIEEAKNILKAEKADSIVYGYENGRKFFKLPKPLTCRDDKELETTVMMVRCRYHVSGTIHVLYADQVNENCKSFKTRKELSEAIAEYKNNNRPYSVRRSVKDGYRYDLIEYAQPATLKEENNTEDNQTKEFDGEVVDTNTTKETQIVQDELSEGEKKLLDRLYEVSKYIVDGLKDIYDIEADPQFIVADMLRDLRLILGTTKVTDLGDSKLDQLTAHMYNDYNQFYDFVEQLYLTLTGKEFKFSNEEKLRQAISMLNSSAYSKESIYRGLGSDRFAQLVNSGAIPCLNCTPNNHMLEEKEEAENNITPDNNLEVEKPEEKENKLLIDGFDIDVFNKDVNEYFDQAYDETIVYMPEKYSLQDDNIIVEGYIQSEDYQAPIIFTLEKKKDLDENANADNKNYKVTNNLSEEVFEFSL